MKLKRFILFSFFSFFSLAAFAQIDLSFIDHLSKNHLKKEHLIYLNNLPASTNSDSVCLLRSKYYLQYFSDSSFYHSYSNCSSLFRQDTTAFNRASILFLKPGNLHQKEWFASFPDENLSFITKNVRRVYLSTVSPLTTNLNDIPLTLQKDFLKYKKAYRKKPIVAAALSMAVPGLGKLYTGRTRSFITTLVTHVIYGIESYESIKKFGIKNGYSIFSLSVFGVFYAANIYGSYHDVSQLKKETRNQYLINANSYYNFNYYSDSY